MEIGQKKGACFQKVKKLEAAKVALEQKYRMELEKLDQEIDTENAQ